MRRFGFGIIPKVVLAALLAMTATVGVFLTVRHGFEQVKWELKAIAGQQVPALIKTTELLEEARQLAALGSDILAFPSRTVWDDLESQLQARAQTVETLLREIAAADLAPDDLRAVHTSFAALLRQQDAILALANQRFSARQRVQDLINRSRRIGQRIDRLADQGDTCATGWRQLGYRAVMELLAVGGADGSGTVRLRQAHLVETLEELSHHQTCLPAAMHGEAEHIGAQLRLLSGRQGLIGAQLRHLELPQELDGKVALGRYLATDLLAAVQRLLDEVQQQTAQHGEAVEQIGNRQVALMGGATLFFLLIILTIYLYLRHALLGRILALQRTLQAYPEGSESIPELETADEIGAIARGIAGFITIIRRREADLLQANAEAQRANSAKSRFLAHISHELRNPLNAVLGFADLLRHEKGLSPQGIKQLGIIRSSGLHLAGLIDDVLDMAIIEADRLHLSPRDEDLFELLESVIAVIQLKAEGKGLAFETRLASDLPRHLRIDGRRLRQILFNLLTNAVKYTSDGWVGLEVEMTSSAPLYLQFSVCDSGCGISDENLAHIFQPFERLHSTEQASTGWGLGLAISRQLVALMGGKLEVSSVPGRGSLFWFDIPVQHLQPAASERMPAQRILGYLGHRRHLLVVDDQVANTELLAAYLQPLGFSVAQAQSSDQALALTRRQAPDLVIMDLVMPETSGYASAQAIRSLPGLAELPIIAVSAAMADRADEVLELGFDAFLAKPVTLKALYNVLKKQLRLQWRFSEVPPPTTADPPMAVPGAEEIDTGRELAELRQWSELNAWADALVDTDPSYNDFAMRLRAFVENEDANGLLTWLDEQNAGN